MNGLGGMGYGQAASAVGDILGLGIGAAFGSDIFGSKPKVAPWENILLGQEQQKALGADIGAFPQISQLGDLYSSYLQDSISKVLPEYKNILAEGGQTTQDILQQADPLIKGEIPPDVAAAVQRSSAYQSLLSGTAGSQMAKGLTARDLGLTSLNLMQQGTQMAGQGANAMQRWNQIASGTVYDPSQMFVTPAQQAALDLKNEEMQQAVQQNRFNVAAAPSPEAQGLYNTFLAMNSQIGGGSGFGSGGPGGGSSSSYGFSSNTVPWYDSALGFG
jgi:hypothetical protein